MELQSNMGCKLELALLLLTNVLHVLCMYVLLVQATDHCSLGLAGPWWRRRLDRLIAKSF